MFERRLVAAILAAALLTACTGTHHPASLAVPLAIPVASAPQTYRLVSQNGELLLLPPGIAPGGGDVSIISAGVAAGKGVCVSAPGVIGIQKNRGKLTLAITRSELAKQPGGWLSRWADSLESAGCIAPGTAMFFSLNIVESIAFDPVASFNLLHAGQVDVMPGARIKTLGPVLRPGAPADAPILGAATISKDGEPRSVTVKATANLIGSETVIYRVDAVPGQAGVRINPVFVEQVIDGHSGQGPQVTPNYFTATNRPAFFRMFYKAGQTDFSALVVSAATHAELDKRSDMVAEDAASCEKPGPGSCRPIARNVGTNVFLPVKVNGEEVLVIWRGNIGEALGRARPASIEVLKPWHGQLMPVDFAGDLARIRRLIVYGGESINWK